jgi:polyhydroxyalkanoate synthesis regulator phasin
MTKRLMPILIVVLLLAVSAISATAILASGDDDSIQTNISTLVESGDLTQEQADAKLAIIQSGTHDSGVWNKKKSSFSSDDYQTKLADLVDSGELTQKQAGVKLKWLQIKLASKY